MQNDTNARGAYADFTLLVDGKNAFPEIIKCIENAKASVYINMFPRTGHIENVVCLTKTDE